MLTKSFVSEHLLHDITEQYTEEQQDTGEISGLDTDILESYEEVAPSKDSVALFLADGTKEVILEECLATEETPDVRSTFEECRDIETKDDSEKSTAATTSYGQTFTNVHALNMYLGFSNESNMSCQAKIF